MNLTIVGTGYVGLVTGVCFAEFGYSVTCIDKDTDRLEKLKSGTCPFFEPGMDKLLDKHINKTKLLSFASSPGLVPATKRVIKFISSWAAARSDLLSSFPLKGG